MSGLEILAAVCSIFQVIGFGRETISLCKKVYRTGGSVDPELAENAAFLDRFSSQIHELDTTKVTVQSRDDQQLYDVLEKCQAASRDLQDEIGFITGHAKQGSLVSTIKIVAKTNWRKRRLEILERKLGDIQKLVEAGLLVRTCNRIDLTLPQFTALDEDLRSFLLNYQAGQRTVMGLISTESLRTRHQISSGVSKLESSMNLTKAEVRNFAKDIKTHVSETVGITMATISLRLQDLRLDEKRQKHRDCLLKGLRFPGMNERQQQITEYFPQTFRWAFGETAFGEDNVGGDKDINHSSVKGSNLETDALRGLRRYQVISDLGISDTPWDSFGDWLRSDSPVYWISGKPGSGKTTLVKYFLSDTETKLALDLWNSGAVLLSHFFWRPGSPMQQNIKGLLCSLLYQLVEANDTLIEYITSHFQDVMRKEAYTDWAIIELKQVFFQTLQNFGRPLCIFIDGLDEVDPADGIFRLFAVVDTIRQSPSTKLCLSSRPEPPIVKRLGRYPQLRMQDLTVEDLWTYGEGMLQFPAPFSGEQHENVRHGIIRGLVKKAEGVFLWLCLAVKSLNAGLDNEDHLEEVSVRAQSLPPDLARLYMDMWTRLNEDHAVYRESAALYLKLVIASQRSPWSQMRGQQPSCLTHHELTVFEMAIATASPEFWAELAILTAEKLVNRCNDTIRLVRTRCAGLLEIVVQTKPIHQKLHAPWQHLKPNFSIVNPFSDGSQTIRFIHRTAFDFLTDTAEGGVILSADVTSEQALYVKLFRGGLSTRYLFPGLASETSPCLEMYTRELSQIWKMGDSCQNYALDLQLQEIATLLELCGSSGSLTLYWGKRTKYKFLRKDEFLVYAALFRLSEYVMAALGKREISDLFKSDILLTISARAAVQPNLSPKQIALAEDLLHRGADPNYKGCILMFGRASTKWSIASPFCEFLRGIITKNLHCHKQNIQSVCHVLDSFLSHGANTSDLVNVNLHILDSGEVKSVSVLEMDPSKYSNYGLEEEDEEGKESFRACSLYVPAFILINALIYELEKTLFKNSHSQEKCCNLDHVATIRAQVQLIDTAAKTRIIALDSGTVYYYTVSDEDSIYLSDAVVKLLTNYLPEGDAVILGDTMLRDRYLEVYQRSERRPNILALLEDEGLIWDFDKHMHEPDEECTCEFTEKLSDTARSITP